MPAQASSRPSPSVARRGHGDVDATGSARFSSGGGADGRPPSDSSKVRLPFLVSLRPPQPTPASQLSTPRQRGRPLPRAVRRSSGFPALATTASTNGGGGPAASATVPSPPRRHTRPSDASTVVSAKPRTAAAGRLVSRGSPRRISPLSVPRLQAAPARKRQSKPLCSRPCPPSPVEAESAAPLTAEVVAAAVIVETVGAEEPLPAAGPVAVPVMDPPPPSVLAEEKQEREDAAAVEEKEEEEVTEDLELRAVFTRLLGAMEAARVTPEAAAPWMLRWFADQQQPAVVVEEVEEEVGIPIPSSDACVAVCRPPSATSEISMASASASAMTTTTVGRPPVHPGARPRLVAVTPPLPLSASAAPSDTPASASVGCEPVAARRLSGPLAPLPSSAGGRAAFSPHRARSSLPGSPGLPGTAPGSETMSCASSTELASTFTEDQWSPCGSLIGGSLNGCRRSSSLNAAASPSAYDYGGGELRQQRREHDAVAADLFTRMGAFLSKLGDSNASSSGASSRSGSSRELLSATAASRAAALAGGHCAPLHSAAVAADGHSSDGEEENEDEDNCSAASHGGAAFSAAGSATAVGVALHRATAVERASSHEGAASAGTPLTGHSPTSSRATTQPPSIGAKVRASVTAVVVVVPSSATTARGPHGSADSLHSGSARAGAATPGSAVRLANPSLRGASPPGQ